MTPAGSVEPSPTAPTRLVYLDVLRGIAVIVMVLAHVVDSWTREADRHDYPYYTAIFVGGLGAPLFLFLAGVAQVMSANAKTRRAGNRQAGMEAMWHRGAEVFALALLFRLQSQLLGWGPLRNLLKVDILNVMGLSMVASALLWRVSALRPTRLALFSVAAAATAFATPVIRSLLGLGALPDPIEAYLRPAGVYATFTLFPWAAFLFAGAVVGELVDATRGSRGGLRLQAPLGLAGVVSVALAWWASFRPSIYTTSEFWSSSPAFFFIRLGIVVASVPATWAHCEFWLALSERAHGGEAGTRVEGLRDALARKIRRYGAALTRAVELLGRSSLFVYWIHVEMVYGIIAEPIKGALPLWASLTATLALCVALFHIVRVKNRWMEGVLLSPRLAIFATVLR